MIPSIYVPTVIVTVCSGTNSGTLFPVAAPDVTVKSFFEIGKTNQFWGEAKLKCIKLCSLCIQEVKFYGGVIALQITLILSHTQALVFSEL